MRMTNPYWNPKGEPWDEKELQDAVKKFAYDEGFMTPPNPKHNIPGLREDDPELWLKITRAQEAFANKLKEAGHDVVPYKNAHEDMGSTSYLVLEPNRLRSEYAQFDPAKLNSRNLSAGLAGILTGGAVLRSANKREQ
jgi:hypothetical protein